MAKNGYAKIFYDFVEATSMLDDAEIGRLTKAIVKYARGDESVESELIGNERFLFPMFKLQIDRDAEKAEESASKNRDNGLKGGRPRKSEKPNAILENPNNPVGFSETQKTHEKEKEKENDYEKEKDNLDHHQECACEETVPEVPFDQMDATNAPDNDTARVCKAYQNQIGQIPGGRAWELLCSYIADIGADAVVVGIEETNIAQPSNGWQYLKKLLDGFAERGVHDADSARAAVNDHKSAVRNARSAPMTAEAPKRNNYQQHTYTDSDFEFFDPSEIYGGAG